MSYHSQVAIVFDTNAFTEEQLVKAENILDSLSEGDPRLIKRDGNCLQFYHAFYKWYDLDEDIESFYSFLKEIPKNSYQFARTGEDPQDILWEDTGNILFEINEAGIEQLRAEYDQRFPVDSFNGEFYSQKNKYMLDSTMRLVIKNKSNTENAYIVTGMEISE